VHFLRFLFNNAASEVLHGSLTFLDAHPLHISTAGRSDPTIPMEVDGDGGAPDICAESDNHKIDSNERPTGSGASGNPYSMADDDDDDNASPLTTNGVSDPIIIDSDSSRA